MFVPSSESFCLMKGILDVAVAIETRHVYIGAEIESGMCEWGFRSWVKYWKCTISPVCYRFPSGFSLVPSGFFFFFSSSFWIYSVQG